MDKNSMSKLIGEELARIPRGAASSLQNQLRSLYEIRRQNCLKSDPTQSPAAPFAKAVEDVRKDHPKFEPNVTDPIYFGWGY